MTSFTNATTNYPVGSNTPIKRVKTTRAPTSTDIKNFIPGDEWLDLTGRDWWKLVYVTQNVAYWVKIGGIGAAIETVTGDSGGAVGPDASNNLNLLGTTGQITVTGNSATNTLTLALAGGSTAIDSIAVDAATGPGTNPVLPTGTGLITITGAQVATGTIGANVVRTNSLAASAFTVQVQRSTAVAGSDSTKNGVSHFDSARFSVDTGGFVSVNGSGIGETITGDSGGALSPSSGNWNILGGPGVTTSGSGSTLTINSVVFTDQGAPATVTSDSGSFATAAITLGTPATPTQGEELIFVCTTAGALIVDAASTHLIRIGSLVTSAGGTMTSTSIGDSLALRYRITDTTWYAVSVIGTWIAA